MNTTFITIKTEPKIKSEMQHLAKELGVSVTTLVNSVLKDVIQTKKVSLEKDEAPNKRLRAVMKKSREDYKKGNTSPAFNTGE